MSVFLVVIGNKHNDNYVIKYKTVEYADLCRVYVGRY